MDPFVYKIKHDESLVSKALSLLDILWRGQDTKYLLIYCIITILFMMMELFYGSSVNSLGLVSDSFHTGFHSMALMISLASLALSRKQGAILSYSYGYDRHKVLSSFANSAFLIFVALFLLVEGVHRSTEPQEIKGAWMVQVSLLGLVINMCGILFFRQHLYMDKRGLSDTLSEGKKKGPMQTRFTTGGSNLQFVFMHIAADAVSSIAVLCSSWLIQINEVMVADVFVSFIVSSLLLYNCFPICIASGMILLQTAPEEMRGVIEKCMREASTVEGVLECHHDHFWTQSPGCYVGSLSVRVHRSSKEQIILANVHRIFSPYITHLTIQVEKDADLDWLPSVDMAHK